MINNPIQLLAGGASGGGGNLKLFFANGPGIDFNNNCVANTPLPMTEVFNNADVTLNANGSITINADMTALIFIYGAHRYEGTVSGWGNHQYPCGYVWVDGVTTDLSYAQYPDDWFKEEAYQFQFGARVFQLKAGNVVHLKSDDLVTSSNTAHYGFVMYGGILQIA